MWPGYCSGAAAKLQSGVRIIVTDRFFAAWPWCQSVRGSTPWLGRWPACVLVYRAVDNFASVESIIAMSGAKSCRGSHKRLNPHCFRDTIRRLCRPCVNRQRTASNNQRFQNETYFSAKQTETGPQAWIQGTHGHPQWSCHYQCAPRKGPQTTECLSAKRRVLITAGTRFHRLPQQPRGRPATLGVRNP